MPATDTKEKIGTSPIDYQRVFVEKVIIHVTAPEDPVPNTQGFELLHGYLCDIYRLRNQDPQLGQIIDALAHKWSVTYKVPQP